MPKRTNFQWQCDRRVLGARMLACVLLREKGYSFKEISVAISLSPNRVRMSVGKWARVNWRKGGAA